MCRRTSISVLAVLLFAATVSRAADQVKIQPDVVYGHKYGMALTFDHFAPLEHANGAGVLFMVSGGWYSHWSPPEETRRRFQPMLESGFTVFAVRHGSSPKFSIPEAVSDVRRAVRFVRKNAGEFGVDPNRVGVFGMSAGGHLSLMLGTTADVDPPDADDPLGGVSSRVQAVVAYVPPTDLRVMVWDAEDHLPAYERFPALDLDVERAAEYSPLLFVTPDDAPTLLIAGEQDTLVPIKHSRNILTAFQREGVPAELVSFPDSGHGLTPKDRQAAMQRQVEWFQKHLVED
ncbi:MAG: alpha/beta hydrolase family protein [Planctomycetota bacterium]